MLLIFLILFILIYGGLMLMKLVQVANISLQWLMTILELFGLICCLQNNMFFTIWFSFVLMCKINFKPLLNSSEVITVLNFLIMFFNPFYLIKESYISLLVLTLLLKMVEWKGGIDNCCLLLGLYGFSQDYPLSFG